MPSTGWLTTFRDATNQLVVTDGDLLDENPPEFGSNSLGVPPPDWVTQIVDKAAPGRRADYRLVEGVGGPEVNGAVAKECAISHALNGDFDLSELWTGMCQPLFGGLADAVPNPASSTWEVVSTSGGLVPDSIAVREKLRARGLFFLPARDNLTERGTLSFALADPVADGVPEAFADEAVFEWEPGGELELLKVEVTGDTLGRPALGTATVGAVFVFNDAVHPTYLDGEWAPFAWTHGPHGGADDGTGRDHLSFGYRDGDPVWHELTWIASWDDCQPVTGDITDATLGIQCDDHDPTFGTVTSTTYDIAVRLTFRSPRYRWTWGLSVTPPRRIFGRNDGLTHGARRVLGGGNTVQQGNRALGGIL